MMNAKLRIKMGTVEVEYEGSDDFLKKELPALLKAVLELHSKSDDGSAVVEVDGGSAPKKAGKLKVSVSTIAATLKSSSGSKLVLAAAAALRIGEGKESFSRSDILKTMQMAKSYYRATYSGNLSNAISTLVKSKDLLDQGSNTFALSDTKRIELEALLAK